MSVSVSLCVSICLSLSLPLHSVHVECVFLFVLFFKKPNNNSVMLWICMTTLFRRLYTTQLHMWDRLTVKAKLQALVYDILASTTAVFSYVIRSRKLSANEQFLVGAQTEVSLLQTTQIKQGESFIAANKVYTSTNKTTIVWIETELFLLPGVDASHVYVGAWALGCFRSHIIITKTFRRAPTASVDSCAEIKSAPSVA